MEHLPKKLVRMSKMEHLPKELVRMSISKSKMDDLPKELVISILLHLAVEDLLRCKCVCKSLYSLITSPSFIDVHRKVRNSYILVKYRDRISMNHVISLLCDETLEVVNTQPVLSHTPLMDSRMMSKVVGCCNGVLCIKFIPHDRYVLWNPATRDAKIIPDELYKSNPDKKMFRHQTMGFGFDSKNNDYKLVSIQRLFSNSGAYPVRLRQQEVEVYSLKTGCWKLLQGIIPTGEYLMSSPSGKGCGGMFSWLVWNIDYVQHKHMISFDMSNEVFITTPLPPCIIERSIRRHCTNTLFFHNTSVAIENCVTDRKNNTETCNIWVLGEYGVKESWTNLFTVGPFDPATRQSIKGLWNNNKVLLEVHRIGSDMDLILVDHFFRKIKDVVAPATIPSIEVFNYQESLVQINACNL